MSHPERARFQNSQTALCSADGREPGLSCRRGPDGKGLCLPPAGRRSLHWSWQCTACTPTSHRHRGHSGAPATSEAQRGPFGSLPLLLSFPVCGLERQTLRLRALAGALRGGRTCHGGPPTAPLPCTPPVMGGSPPPGHPRQLTWRESSSSQALASLGRKDSTRVPQGFPRAPRRTKCPAGPCSSPGRRARGFGGSGFNT